MPANAYTNFVNKLAAHNATLTTTQLEFTNGQALVFTCQEGHTNTLSKSSLSNKFSAIASGKVSNICKTCSEANMVSTEETGMYQVCKKFGHTFVSFDPTSRKTTFICKCGKTITGAATNYLRDDYEGTCRYCQHDTKRIPIETIQATFNELGCELISDYVSNNEPVQYKCRCKGLFTIRYKDLVSRHSSVHCG